MSRRRLTGIAVFMVIVALTCAAQDITDEPSRPMVWDGTHGVAFFGTGGVSPSNLPIRSYTADGTKRTSDINIFKDFPGLQQVVVDDAGAGPDDVTVIAAVLNFGESKLRHVILTYTRSGELAKVWDTAPYYPDAVAVDSDGSVYALADRLDVGTDSVHPLLIHYSADGKVIQQGLPSSKLAGGGMSVDSTIEPGANYSRPVLTIQHDRLLIYAPTSREIVICDRSGEVSRVIPLAPILEQVAKEDGVDRIGIAGIGFGTSEALVVFWEATTQQTRELFTARLLNVENLRTTTLLSTAARMWTLLGINQNRWLYLQRGAPKMVLQSAAISKP